MNDCEWCDWPSTKYQYSLVWSGHAHKLHAELAAANAEIERLREQLSHVVNHCEQVTVRNRGCVTLTEVQSAHAPSNPQPTRPVRRV